MKTVDQIIRRAELEDLLAQRYDGERILCPQWLHLVRRLPCVYPGCRQHPAGTAHHIWTAGTGWKCSDFLTIPLCSYHHVMGPDPVQMWTSERFLEVFGRSEAEVVRDVFTRIRTDVVAGEVD